MNYQSRLVCEIYSEAVHLRVWGSGPLHYECFVYISRLREIWLQNPTNSLIRWIKNSNFSQHCLRKWLVKGSHEKKQENDSILKNYQSYPWKFTKRTESVFPIRIVLEIFNACYEISPKGLVFLKNLKVSHANSLKDTKRVFPNQKTHRSLLTFITNSSSTHLHENQST